jgi:hypothetical protein
MKEPYLILEEEVALWADIFPATAITVRSRPHAPAPTPEQCEKRNCLECPLWDKCSVMEYMPMCSRATYDGVRKNAARAATLATLNDLCNTFTPEWTLGNVISHLESLRTAAQEVRR